MMRAGRKLAQVVASNRTFKRTDYAGELMYEDDVLQFVSHEEGRVVTATTKLIYRNSFDNTSGLNAVNANLTAVETNGTETYVQVVSAGTTVPSGIESIGSGFPVTGGERYKIRVKGYLTNASATNLATLRVKLNGVVVAGVSSSLPKGLSNESWIEVSVDVPGAGQKILDAGVMWQESVNADESFMINEIEIEQLPSTSPEYQYFMKDHLGNVRLTFTTKQETETATATYEEANKSEEQGKFLRYTNAKRVSSPLFDHTNGTADGYAQRLSGQENEVFGLAKSLSVMPGDVIKMEVYAKYIDANQSNHLANLTALLTQIATNAPGVVTYDGAGYAVSTSSFPFAAGLNGTSGSSGTGPKAYLNWLVFNKDYVLIPAKSGYKRMTTTGREYGQDVPHELLNGTINIDEPGYVYIYISNEEGASAYEVYFDDFKVDHMKSPVIQMEDYYAFGLTFNSYQRENSVAQDYTYNGKEEQDELGLGWLDYGARMYMSDIGRWGVIDPLADKFQPVSPYNYAFNNPVLIIDPDGRSGEVSIDKDKKTVTVTSHYVFYGAGGSDEQAKQSAADIQNQWNGANAKVTIDGVEYSVSFAVTGEYKSDLTQEEVEKNTDIKNNYIQVVETGIDVSFMDGTGSNSGVWLKKNIDGAGTTTEAHEAGHGMGAVKGTSDGHPADTDLRGKGQAGILYPRGTAVDAEYTYDPSKGATTVDPVTGARSNTLNPAKRQANQGDVNYLGLAKLKYSSSGRLILDLLQTSIGNEKLHNTTGFCFSTCLQQFPKRSS